MSKKKKKKSWKEQQSLREKPRTVCSCTQNFSDALRAAKPKKELLKKVTCAKCGKVFLTNMDTNLCYDCNR